MRISARASAAVLVASSLTIACAQPAIAGGDWPDGPNKTWFEGLQRPDNGQQPYRDAKSRSCCGVADTVRTKFKVEPGSERYPEDRWYAWLNDQWTPIPPEKIVHDHAPDGQPYLFLLAGTIQCFVPPKGGL